MGTPPVLMHLVVLDVMRKLKLTSHGAMCMCVEYVCMHARGRAHTHTCVCISAQDTDQTHHYLDGELLGTTSHPPGTIANMDCNMDGPDAYFGT